MALAVPILGMLSLKGREKLEVRFEDRMCHGIIKDAYIMLKQGSINGIRLKSDHSGIKSEINNMVLLAKIARKHTSILRLMTHF